MTWVVIAIVAFMVIYTLVNVKFRKEEAPHQPYEEAQERQSRFFDFDMNGWKWMTVETTARIGPPFGEEPGSGHHSAARRSARSGPADRTGLRHPETPPPHPDSRQRPGLPG